MTDIDNLIAAYAERTEKRPICEQTAYEAIRHINRNCDMLCESHEDGSECVEWARYDGTLLAQIWNAFPALASELEAARKVVAAAQARHETWWCWVLAKGPWTSPEWIELDRLTVDEKDALREYLRVMEEQR